MVLKTGNEQKIIGSLDALSGRVGDVLYVKASGNGIGGKTWATAFTTLQAAVTAASDNDTILVAPGEYDEAVTLPRATSPLTIVGLGGRGAAYVAPSTANATALTILSDDVTLVNLGCDGDGTGHGIVNYGRRTRAYRCKIEGGTDGLRLTLATVAQEAAGTHGKGDDSYFEDCEFAYNTNGVNLVGTDYGGVTQAKFKGCRFHDNTAADFEEAIGSGGSAAVLFFGLVIEDCTFERLEDGTEPTKYISLDDDNANSGIVTRCSFPSAINGGKNLVSTSLLWVGNYHTGGISTGQPS